MSILIKNIKFRMINDNKNWLAVICGATGTGKSWCALRLAEQLDSKFSIERVVFTVKDFMGLINSKKLRKGSMIIFDEAGVEISSREWYSVRNKSINYVFQTFRHLNLGVIFTTPDFKFVDNSTRRLFHTYIETMKINKEDNDVLVRWFQVQNNPKEGKIYYKRPRIQGSNFKPINTVRIGKPSDEIIEQYEKKKMEFTKKLKDDIESDIKDIEIKKHDSKPKLLDDIIEDVIKKKKKYMKIYQNRKYIDRHLIMKDYNLSINQTNLVKSQAEKSLGIKYKP